MSNQLFFFTVSGLSIFYLEVLLEISENYKSYVFFIIITISLILISSFFWGSKGPVIILLLVAIILTIKLSGIHFMNENIKRMGPWMVTQFGSLVFIHSHHIKKLREAGKEFKLKGKYFCTACYGMCLGTIVSIILIIIYLTYGFVSEIIIPLIILTIFFMIPIVLRYTIFIHMRSSLRFLSNAILPIGLVLLLCILDKLFQNWIINSMYELSLLGIAFLRLKIGQFDDKRLLRRIDITQ